MCAQKALYKTRTTLAKAPVVGKWFAPKPKVAVLRAGGSHPQFESRGGRGGISHERLSSLIEKAFEAQPVCGMWPW